MKRAKDPLPQYVRRADVRRMLGNMSGQRVDALVAAGVLPAPVKLGERTSLFRLDQVEAALARIQREAA